MTTRETMREVDIAVVGAGPGGLSAALAAARAGADRSTGSRVTLLDAHPCPGGQYYHQPPEWARGQADRHAREGRVLWEQAKKAGAEFCPETVVWNLEPGKEAADRHRLSITGPEGSGEVYARAVILATGAVELPVVFPGWTLDGVMTASVAQALIANQVRPGLRALVAGTGPLLLTTAGNLMQGGLHVVVALEGSRTAWQLGLRHAGDLWGQSERIWEGLIHVSRMLRHSSILAGWGIISALGGDHVEGALIAQLDDCWRPVAGTEQKIACDLICTAYGLVPFHGLSRLAGVEQIWQPALGGEVPRRDAWMQTSLPGIYAVGDGAGIGGHRLALLEGQVAGLAAAVRLGWIPLEQAQADEGRLQPALSREHILQAWYAGHFTPGPGMYELAQPDTIVCRCQGVTQARVQDAVARGATSMAALQAETGCGNGECRGRACTHQVMHTLARLTNQPPEQVGFYPAEPPLFTIH